MFDSYANADDAQINLNTCTEHPVSLEFVRLLAKSYKSNVDLFKTNFNQILSATEKLLLSNNIQSASEFVNQVVLEHFDTIGNIEPLLQMFVRVCPLVNVDCRNKFSLEIILPVTYKCGEIKCKKTFAGLFFDFALRILDLCVIQAPKCADHLLQKTDFYPWKELAPCFSDLIRLCVAYERIDIKLHDGDLGYLTNILRMAVDRGKVYTVIFRATHDPALQALLHWSGSLDRNATKVWPIHVYQMGEVMSDLIDDQKITAEHFAQFIEALHKRIIDHENNGTDGNVEQYMISFFSVSKIFQLHSHEFCLC